MKYLYIIGFVLLLLPSLVGQDKKPFDFPDKIKVEEHLVLWTDREVYLTGETIWFSADYLVNSKKIDESLSKVLYIELLSFSGQSVAKNKFKIDHNKVYGNLGIPLSLQTGYYLLRVYTQYQRNLNPADITNHQISVINPVVPNVKIPRKKDTEIQTFFIGKNHKNHPSFGVLLKQDDIKKAIIVDVENQRVFPFRLLKNGMGFCKIDSVEHKTYLLKTILLSDDTIEKKINFKLPDIFFEIDEGQGVTNVKLSISSRKTSMQDGEYTLSLFSKYRQKVLETELLVKHQKCLIQWPARIFQHGINYLVLQNSNDDIVYIKAIYHLPEDAIPLTLKTNKDVYHSREDVFAEIDADQLPDNFDGHLSVTVIKQGTRVPRNFLPAYLAENPLLLPSYLQNTPKYPKSLREQVDLIMAIYSKQLNESDLKLFNDSGRHSYWLPETRGVSIRGIVKAIDTPKGVPNIEVMLSVLGSEPQLQIFRTNNNGEFLFSLNHISDLTNVYLTLKSPRENELEILIDNDFMNEIPLFFEPDFALDTNMREVLEELYINAQVSEQIFHDDTVSKIKENVFRFKPDETIYLNDYVSMQSLETVINEIVPHVKVRKKSQHSYFRIYDGITGVYYEDPLVLIDNLPIYSIDELMNIHPSQIEKIEVVNHTYVYGDIVIRGMVAIFTSTDNFGNISLPESFTSLEFQALSTPTSFSPSDFKTSEKKASRSPDFRNVLYWNPDFKLSEHNTNFSFFTSDHSSTYEITLRGITDNGRMVFGTKTFFVE